MKTYVVLLRGVMPSGRNKVPMAQLREALEANGFDNVRTYIQSGNALVDTDLPASKVQQRVHEIIKANIGADLAIVVRTGIQLQRMLHSNPFQRGYDIKRVFFVLFASTPPLEKVKVLSMGDFGDGKLAFTRGGAYLYIPGVYGKNRLSGNFLERQLGISATMRNFNTMSRLTEMSKG